jgi:hypothetical protein
VRGSGSAWAFTARAVLALLIVTLAVFLIFRRRSSRAPTPAPVHVAAGTTRDETAARGAAAASAARLEEERRKLAARNRRDSLRDDIYRGLGKRPPDVTEKAPGKRTLPGSSPVPLDRKYIQERIREDFVPLAKVCYDALLAQKPTARGKVVFSFAIVGDAETGGIVEFVELDDGTTLSDPEFAYCVTESLLSVSFVPPPKDGWVTITYPIDFSPD